MISCCCSLHLLSSIIPPPLKKRKGSLAISALRIHVINYDVSLTDFEHSMLLSKEYVGYLAREITNKLVEGEFIETPNKAAVAERVNAALLDELTLEDRINDEVRIILDTYSDEMTRSGANYQEMFKKIKNELVRKYKAVL
jgi:Protein of unknown function (DUF507)